MPHQSRATLALATLLALPLSSCDKSVPTGNSFSNTRNRSHASSVLQAATRNGDQFTDRFPLEACTFSSSGRNPYFPLIPGSVRVLTAVVDGVTDSLEITTLNETLMVGGVEARIIEERHIEGGELVEVSRNYFAHCAPSNSVFYFGEDVDNYENGKIINHDGTWRHGVNGARAGLQMAGLALLGSRYFQEIAPEVALDQAETIQLDATVGTPFRDFRGNVLVSQEGTPLEPGILEYKYYAPGVGLVRDADLRLVSYH